MNNAGPTLQVHLLATSRTSNPAQHALWVRQTLAPPTALMTVMKKSQGLELTRSQGTALMNLSAPAVSTSVTQALTVTQC